MTAITTAPCAKGNIEAFEAEVADVTRHLLQKYGPLLDRDALVEVLRFQSAGAFDRYRQRGLLNLRLARARKRTGVFASAHDTAMHVVQLTWSGNAPKPSNQANNKR